MTAIVNLGAGSAVWSRRLLLTMLSAAAFMRPARSEGLAVEISEFKFAPADIEIAVGSVVAFVNLDLAPHTATGESFDTGMLRQGERKEIAFQAAGAFPYYCRFHRHMTGRILVR